MFQNVQVESKTYRMKNGKDKRSVSIKRLRVWSLCPCSVCMGAQEVSIEASIPFHFPSWAERGSRFYPW